MDALNLGPSDLGLVTFRNELFMTRAPEIMNEDEDYDYDRDDDEDYDNGNDDYEP